MRIPSGASRGTSARARSPNTEGKPSRSTLTTAMVSLSARNTMARAVNSPCLDFAAEGMPIPPLIGNKGSGVIIRLAAPASKEGFDWPRITDPPHAPHHRARQRDVRSEEHTSELQSLSHLVCRLLLE